MYTIWINGFCFRSISEFLDSIFVPKKMYGSMKKKIMNALGDDNVFVYEGIAFVVRSHPTKSLGTTRRKPQMQKPYSPSLLAHDHVTHRLGAYCGGGW